MSKRGRLGLAIAFVFVAACDGSDKLDAKPEPNATPSASAAPSEPPPGPCAASEKPVELGATHGHVYGFAGDATHLYFTSWQLYGGRGDLGRVRKDGKGKENLSSLSLEPRGLVVDASRVFYTAGIRLMSLPKAGGEPKTFVETFSSQSIAGDSGFVYGVPGDYGPYDRLIRAEKSSGKTKELDVSERPDAEHPPFGFSAIAVDGAGIYVTDSSKNRVLRFPLDRGKPKVLSTNQDKAYDLAIDSNSVYFTLAQKGDLLKVPKAGGAAQKIASGLAIRSRIAADDKGVFATLAGKDEGPQTLVRIGTDGGEPTGIASIPKADSVEAIAVDDRCVYWIRRDSTSHQATVYARAR